MTDWASRAAVRAAVDLLRETWAPGPAARIDILGELVPPGEPDPACDCGRITDQDDTGGTDATDDAGPLDGDPVCSHTRLCFCPACVHADRLRRATCAVAGCGRPTRIQITPWALYPWSLHPGTTERDLNSSTDLDADLEATGTFGVGDDRRVYAPLFACGTAHARLLVDDDRRRQQVGSEPARYYDATPWTYEPDQVDVDAPINQVPGHLDFAQWYAESAMSALYAGDRARHDECLSEVRQSLIWALSALTAHTEQLDDQEP